ncbi:metal ABC transporter substrate-binding protein [Alcaligenaceae bacterium]|nr:metal ABC transporter substrate-binding protein [Alcaligenaceae bacterium]
MLNILRFNLLFLASRRAVLQGVAGVALVLAASVGFASEAAPLRVVASFSILGDMVKEVGGERIVLSTIVGPNSDAHSFEPTPQDVKALAQAQVLVINGLDFEGWLPRLIQAAGFKGEQVLASKGVEVRHLSAIEQARQASAGHTDREHHNDVDPHAWQSLTNGMIYVKNIADGLSQADPKSRAYYQSRAQAYIVQMKKLDTEIKQTFEAIPQDKRKVITSHDAFGYFAQAYGIQFISVVGLSNEAEPSAKEVAAIIDMAKKQHISGVFIENTSNSKLAKQIARETGAKVGGTLYSDALAPADQPAATYLGMFSWNAGRLSYVLSSTP